MRRSVWLVLVLAFALVVAACGGDDDAATTTAGGSDDATETTASGGDDAVNQRSLRIVVVSHGQSSDPFWSVAANGVNDAADGHGYHG